MANDKRSSDARATQRQKRKPTSAEEEQRFQRTKSIWTSITNKALDLRDKEREFHGFKGELRRFGAAIREQYEASKAINHIRDLGMHREEILRSFLNESGLIAERYGVSKVSSRVVSKSGHSSNEMDILFTDRASNIILRKFGQTLEFYPTETVLGTLQVKSNLTYKEIDSAIANVASFKKLYETEERENESTDGGRGFGIIFAYTSDLSYSQIAKRIEAALPKYRSTHLPNSIVILDGSVLRFGDKNGGYLLNNRIDGLVSPTVWGASNITGEAFYSFYSDLTNLLRARRPSEISLSDYYDLPLVAGDISYRFRLSASDEIAKCLEHGEYLRRLTKETARKVHDFVIAADPINWIRALDIAAGKSGDDYEAYLRQPGAVHIYNPLGMSMANLLIGAMGQMTYDDVQMMEMNVWIPWYYDEKDCLFSRCPTCSRLNRKELVKAARRIRTT